MIRNFKRVHVAEVEFTRNGLNVIGGGNAQGKSTFLDAIKFLLGGKKYAPSNAHNTESGGATAMVRTTLSNGIEVERSGKSSTLKVKVGEGKGNQSTLKEFLNEFALDINVFMRATDKEKAKLLIAHLGIGEQLETLETKIKRCFDERTDLSREVKRKLQLFEAIQTFPEAPEKKLNVVELSADLRAKEKENEAADKAVERMSELREDAKAARAEVIRLEAEIVKMKSEHDELDEAHKAFTAHDLSALEAQMQKADAINAQIDSNAKSKAADAEYKVSKKQETKLSDSINEAREQLAVLISSIKMPLEELEVVEGDLVFKGQRWDCMSGSQRLIVATAISRAFKPECGFVLVDELEQMDWKTIEQFDSWAVSQGIQVIGAMVCDDDKSGDNVIIISNGEVKA